MEEIESEADCQMEVKTGINRRNNCGAECAPEGASVPQYRTKRQMNAPLKRKSKANQKSLASYRYRFPFLPTRATVPM